MRNKKLGLIAIVIAALLVSSVAAWTILGWTIVTVTNYSVKQTTATWEAWGSSWTSPPLTLSLGDLYGAQEGSADGWIRLTVTTYAPVKVTFAVGDDSALSGLQAFKVTIDRDGYGRVGELTATYSGGANVVVDTPGGSLTYVYHITVWGKAVDYASSPISGYINLYAMVETPLS